MQLGGRDLGNGDGAQQSSEMAMTSTAVPPLEHGHLGPHVAGQTMGVTWPLNIFDIGQQGS